MDLNGRAVAVVGAATAGAEIAGRLAASGATVVVFEQNPRPYGKIEDGLPRWHRAQRAKEYGVIDGKLDHENVWFVPSTRLGRDISLSELENDWGFSRVVLAVGAWRDRPLPLPGASELEGKGFVYQNPLIYWFNHHHEPHYAGDHFDTPDGSLIIGGGLASIDVAKVMMLCTVQRALTERGHPIDPLEMEHRGIDRTLEEVGLDLDALQLRGATIFYRKRREDMPLVAMPEAADDKRKSKIEASRVRLADKAMKKYLFRIEPLMRPEGFVVEDGRAVGMRFRQMSHTPTRGFEPSDETTEKRTPMIVSSIGSIPEPLDGVPMKGELYDFEILDRESQLVCLAGHPKVFAAGNAVTGKGNIVASRKHGAEVAERISRWLLGEGAPGDESEAILTHAEQVGNAVANHLADTEPLSSETLAEIRSRVEARWNTIGYRGAYSEWMARAGTAS